VTTSLVDDTGRRAPWNNERYEPISLLGHGSFGDVYLVRDTLRGETVALKWLRTWDAAALIELRKEFRALKDLEHPNLVVLYELHADVEGGFLTMEVVDGVDVRTYTREAAGHEDRRTRVLRCLAQIVEAVDALHAQGTVHRDLKPSNILVTASGRVVILDAGLAKSIESQRSSGRYLCGTAEYMSPEQAFSQRLDTATDLYSIGVIAFELFTGSLPFVGPSLSIIQEKVSRAARPIRHDCPDLAVGDAEILDRLLARDPSTRPTVNDLRTWLARALPLPGGPPAIGSSALAPSLFVGRDVELAKLDDALASARQTGFALCTLSGPSGIGKTTLLQRWLAHSMPDVAFVLTGRCYQRETVPFNGLEQIFDALMVHARSGEVPADLISADERATLGLVLGDRIGFSAVTESARSGSRERSVPPDPLERRRVVSRALCRLVRHVAGNRTAIVWLDDLQWAAEETAALLTELSRAEWQAGCCVILSFRPAGAEDTPCISSVLASIEPSPAIELGPLDNTSALALVTAWTEPLGGETEARVRLVAEAKGEPFLLEQAARHLACSPDGALLDLASILRLQVSGLDAASRSLLQTLSVAAEPLRESVALEASGLAAGKDPARRLVALRLVQRVGKTGHLLVPFHDRLRETVTADLCDEETRHLHLRIAEALERSGHAEPEVLVGYFLAAGARARAAGVILEAARRLTQALAFGRAATLFRRSLELAHELGREATLRTRISLADALVNAGRNEEGARVLLEAAGASEGARRDDLVGRAARELIRSGQVDEGVSYARRSLSNLGVRLSRSAFWALPRIGIDRFLLTLRGLRYQLASAEASSAALLSRIDWCQALAAVLPLIDTIRGYEVHNQGLRWALQAGEPSRLARALAMEGGYRMALSAGRDPRGRTRALLDTALILARGSGDPGALGFVEINTGSACWSAADWAGCVQHVATGVDILRRKCVGVSWEINLGQTHALNALFLLGELRKHRVAVASELEDARARGDLYAETMYTLRDVNSIRLIDDNPDSARLTAHALKRWTNGGFQIEHLVELYQQTEVDLYERHGAAALARVERTWSALVKSQLLRLEVFRIELTALRARATLAAAAEERDDAARRRLLRTAKALSRSLEQERTSIRGAVFGAPIAAAVAFALGDRARAGERLRQGIEASVSSQMRLHEHMMRYWRGRLLGGSFTDEVSRSEAWMRDEGIVRPERYVHLMAPGFDSLA
jgi:hypothetical protein